MEGTQFAVSLLGGGLAGGCVNTIFNRIFYWRSLRIGFHPKLSNIYAVYVIRMEDPKGQYFVTTVGKVPLPDDDSFVRQRTHFLLGLIEFTELREVRKLRKAMLATKDSKALTDGGTISTTDLMPEFEALDKCLKTMERRLKLS